MREANVLAVTVALATMATVASAKTLPRPLNSIIYDCRVNGSHSLYWIPSQLIFAYDASTRRVQVLNPLVMRYIGHLISGAFSKDSGSRLVFEWRLKQVDSRHGHVQVRYRARVGHDGHTRNVQDTIQDFANFDEAHGDCTLK